MPSLAQFKEHVLIALRFVLFILLIPIVLASVKSFMVEFQVIGMFQKKAFVWGLVMYTLAHLVICELQVVYDLGQKIMGRIFGFFRLLSDWGPVLLPFYVIVFLSVLMCSRLFKDEIIVELSSLFFAGMGLALHIIFTSKTAREHDPTAIRSDHFFAVSLCVIASLTVTSLFLSFSYSRFSFSAYVKESYEIARWIYGAVWRQLF